MICEMFSCYAARGIRLTDKLQSLYDRFGFCRNTLHSFQFEGSAGFARMQGIMASFRKGVSAFGGKKVEKCLDYSVGLEGLPKSDVLKFYLTGGTTVVVRPSGTEPKLKLYLSVTARDAQEAQAVENAILKDAEVFFQ